MKVIRPTTITNTMVLSNSISEPDTSVSEIAWSATEICASGDRRYVGAPSSAVTISQAAPAVVTWAAHGLAVDTEVVFTTTGTLPAGLTAGQTYYVLSAPSTSTFTVSETIGGRQIATTSAGSGTHTATCKVHTIYEAVAGQRGTITSVDTAAETVTYVAHGLPADTPIVFTSTGTVPGGLTAGTTYYVKSPTTDTFQVAASAGGSAINLTSAGSGTISCGLAANYNKPPAINTSVWAYVAPTNAWAWNDQSLASYSQANDLFRLEVQPGRFNALALIRADAADAEVDMRISRATVTITNATPAVVTYAAHGFAADTPVRLSTTGALPTGLAIDTTYYVRNPATNTFELSATAGGASIATSSAGSGTHTLGKVVYSNSIDLNNGVLVGSWYAFFNEPIYQRDSVAITDLVDAALLDLPLYQEGVLTVNLTRSGGVVSLGALVVGRYLTLGDTLPEPEIGRIDYSAKNTTTGGVDPGAYSDTGDYVVRVAKADVDNVVQVLRAYQAVPMVFIGHDTLYSSLITYGWLADTWKMRIGPGNNPLYSYLSMHVESLTTA